MLMSVRETPVERSYEFQGLPLTVSSQDDGVAAAIDYRLRSCPQAPSGSTNLRIELRLTGHATRPLPPFGSDGWRPVYDTPAGEVAYRPADDRLRADFGSVRMHGAIDRGLVRMSAESYAHESQYLAAHPLTMVALCELLKRHGRYNLHAGCVAHEGHGALIAGPSGTGKSTLVLALAKAGLDFLSDDMTFLAGAEDGVEAHGFADAIGVTPDTAARFSELSDLAQAQPRPGFRKHLVRIEERFSARVVPRCRPRFLVFPELVPGRASRLEALDPQEAWLRLVPDVLLTHPAATQAHLAIVAALSAQVTCYRLKAGHDIDRSAELVTGLLR
jgi:hypothetical protein